MYPIYAWQTGYSTGSLVRVKPVFVKNNRRIRLMIPMARIIYGICSAGIAPLIDPRNAVAALRMLNQSSLLRYQTLVSIVLT